MKSLLPVASAAAVTTICVFALSALAETRPSSSPAAHQSSSPLVDRGRYLVRRVGLCADCHSPRDASGNFIETKHLTGSPVGFTPTVPMPWSPVAPRIAGLPEGFSRADMIHFLMTGERPNGRPGPLAPMPPYRFDRSDAEAVTAYLESLPRATD